MRRYLFIRILHSLITLLVVSFVVFGMGRLSGNPLDILLPEDATQEQYDRLNQRWGFDQPIVVQYWKFIQNAVQGDLGDSLVKPRFRHGPSGRAAARNLPVGPVLPGYQHHHRRAHRRAGRRQT